MAAGASQVLPVDGHKRLIGLLGVADDLGDAVLPPQSLDLLVALHTQVEGVASPAGTARGRSVSSRFHLEGCDPKSVLQSGLDWIAASFHLCSCKNVHRHT